MSTETKRPGLLDRTFLGQFLKHPKKADSGDTLMDTELNVNNTRPGTAPSSTCRGKADPQSQVYVVQLDSSSTINSPPRYTSWQLDNYISMPTFTRDDTFAKHSMHSMMTGEDVCMAHKEHPSRSVHSQGMEDFKDHGVKDEEPVLGGMVPQEDYWVLQRDYNHLVSRYKQLKAAHRCCTPNLQAERTRALQEKLERESKVVLLEQMLATERARCRGLASSEDKMRRQINQLRTTVDTQKSDVAALRKELANVQQERQRLMEKLKVAQREAAEEKRRNKDCSHKAAPEDVTEQLHELSSQLWACRKSVGALQEKLAMREEEVVQRNETIAALNQELDNSDCWMEALQKEYEWMRATLNELRCVQSPRAHAPESVITSRPPPLVKLQVNFLLLDTGFEQCDLSTTQFPQPPSCWLISNSYCPTSKAAEHASYLFVTTPTAGNSLPSKSSGSMCSVFQDFSHTESPESSTAYNSDRSLDDDEDEVSEECSSECSGDGEVMRVVTPCTEEEDIWLPAHTNITMDSFEGLHLAPHDLMPQDGSLTAASSLDYLEWSGMLRTLPM